MYEISERQAVDRYVLTEDYYVIGDDVSSATNKAIFSGQNVITAFENEINGVFIAKYPTVAICETDAVSTKFALPVVSLGIGNSLLYTFEFKDNYSAGNISTQGSDPNAQPQNFFNVQQYAPYGSNLGKFNNINIKLALHAQIPTDFASAIAIGNALPIIDDNNGAYTLVNFTDVDLQVYKDNREKLIFNHQVHFVSNWDNLIIGSGFASNSLLVGGQYESAWKLYILPKKINKFDKTIDLTGATQLSSNMYADYGVGYDAVNYNKIYFNGNPTATDNGKAWAIVREINGKNELIFGRNIDIINNDEIELPTISLVHDIFKRN